MISCALKKFTGHLWYLSSKTAAFTFFDSNVPAVVKRKIVETFKNTNDLRKNSKKRYIIPLMDAYSIKNKYNIYGFINSLSMKLFQRFNITLNFWIKTRKSGMRI